MSNNRTFGIWLIMFLFGTWGVYSIITGILSIISPYTMINFLIYLGIAPQIGSSLFDFFGANPINGEPLFSILPYMGVLTILLGILLVVDVFGLFTFKGWSWLISAFISFILMFLIIGIFLTWILDEDNIKTAYGQV
ncbi:MAG: hypothetical protein ACTSRG_18655 [Candidatus Helarchaeota archaeon]